MPNPKPESWEIEFGKMTAGSNGGGQFIVPTSTIKQFISQQISAAREDERKRFGKEAKKRILDKWRLNDGVDTEYANGIGFGYRMATKILDSLISKPNE